MQGIQKIRMQNPKLATAIMDRGGFILDNEIDELIKVDRLLPVLVRCNNGRFTTPVQDLKHFIGIINSQRNMVEAYTTQKLNPKTDWVRDVSLLA